MKGEVEAGSGPHLKDDSSAKKSLSIRSVICFSRLASTLARCCCGSPPGRPPAALSILRFDWPASWFMCIIPLFHITTQLWFLEKVSRFQIQLRSIAELLARVGRGHVWHCHQRNMAL